MTFDCQSFPIKTLELLEMCYFEHIECFSLPSARDVLVLLKQLCTHASKRHLLLLINDCKTQVFPRLVKFDVSPLVLQPAGGIWFELKVNVVLLVVSRVNRLQFNTLPSVTHVLDTYINIHFF